jgi:hypothetical protein
MEGLIYNIPVVLVLVFVVWCMWQAVKAAAGILTDDVRARQYLDRQARRASRGDEDTQD